MKYSHRFIVFIWLLCFCWLPALNAQENTIVDNSDLEDIFQTNKTPIWDYVFLRNTTKEFLETAKSLERDLLSYQDRLANENEKNLILNQAINVANLNVDLAKIGLDYAEQSLSVARQNADIAQTRVRNKFEQANDGRATLNFIKKKHEDIANSGFLVKLCSRCNSRWAKNCCRSRCLVCPRFTRCWGQPDHCRGNRNWNYSCTIFGEIDQISKIGMPLQKDRRKTRSGKCKES